MPPRAERFEGCLLGQAVGDALGFVVEGQVAAECSAHVQAVVLTLRTHGWSRPPYRTGQYSDDTQLARELATSLVERGGFDAAHYAARIASIFGAGRVVGAGPSTEAAARRLAAGVPWHAAGTPAPAAGNGGAMRVAPLALLLAHDLAALHEAAHDQARITHADPRCSAGACVIARTVAAALRDELHDPPALCRELVTWAGSDAALAAALEQLPGWLALDPAAAARAIAPVGQPAGNEDAGFGIAAHVTPSVLWSLYAALRHRDDYLAAIGTAIAVGGDVDTTAAMTGAIVGAALGVDTVPAPLRALVHDRGEQGADALHALARRLHRLAGG